MKKLFVGNLPFSASDFDVEDLFSAHGDVFSVRLIADFETGKPRGFGFVEMDQTGAEQAIEELNGFEFGGRCLRVNEAHERGRKSRSAAMV